MQYKGFIVIISDYLGAYDKCRKEYPIFGEYDMSEKTRMKSSERTKLMVMVSLTAVIISICSWISIPMVVPFTLQTFAVFFAFIFLGGVYGTLSVVIYILLGVIGVPVFSGFKSGVAVISGPTGGYIVGFVLSGLIYILVTKLLGEKKFAVMLALILGLLVCYVFGTLWFMYVYSGTENAKSFMTVLSLCVFPFIIPDICKMILAYILARIVKKAVR